MLIINDQFYERARDVFNPRNVMFISRNDGKFNNQVNHQRDTIINSNTMVRLSRKYYSADDMTKIKEIKKHEFIRIEQIKAENMIKIPI